MRILFLFLSGALSAVLLAGEFGEDYEKVRMDMRYFSHERPPLMICFVGLPGTGKTTISWNLLWRLQGLYFSEELVQKFVHSEASRDRAQTFYRMMAESPNRLWIIDSSVEKCYPGLRAYCNRHKIPLVLVCLDAPDPVLRERLRQRQGMDVALQNFPFWRAAYERFQQEGEWDLQFDTSQTDAGTIAYEIEQFARIQYLVAPNS